MRSPLVRPRRWLLLIWSVAFFGVISLVIITGWGHWRFQLWTPDVAKKPAIEAHYWGLLTVLREYIPRIPVEGSTAVALALRDDPKVQEWCTRPELLAITIRPEAGAPKDLYIHGAPTELLGSSWFSFHLPGRSAVTHGRKYSGPSRLEFVEYCEVVKAGEAEYWIELTLDLLQLQGLRGLTWWNSPGGPTDPK